MHVADNSDRDDFVELLAETIVSPSARKRKIDWPWAAGLAEISLGPANLAGSLEFPPIAAVEVLCVPTTKFDLPLVGVPGQGSQRRGEWRCGRFAAFAG